jgi:PST family polysaccharide transporter
VSTSSFRTAVGWSLATTGGQQALSALFTFVLAALLGPEAFGLVAMAAVYVAFVQLVLEQGMSAAIVQRRDLSEDHLNAAFWMVVAASLVLTAISLGLAGWWARVNSLPELAPVIRLLALGVPLEGLMVVQRALLHRQMNFRAFAIRATVSMTVGGIVGLILAWRGFGAYALVAQTLTTSTVGLALFWILSGWRPRLRFAPRAARELMGFSAGTLLGKLGIFVNRRSDALLMGLFFGPTAVGLYRLADRLVGVCVEFAAVSVQSVALPEFSRFQTSHERLRASFVRCLRISACLALPVLGVLAAGAPEVVSLLGERWQDAAPALAALCVVGVVRDLGLFTGPLLQALGRPHALAALVWAQAVPSALAFAAVGWWLSGSEPAQQALGIAVSRAAVFALLFLVNLTIARGLVGIRLRSVGSALSPAFAAAVVGGLSVLMARPALAWIAHPSLRAVATLAPAGGLAVAALLLLDGDARRLLGEGWLRLRSGASGTAALPRGADPSSTGKSSG